MINKGTSTSAPVMQKVCAFFFTFGNFHITPVSVEGIQNTIANTTLHLYKRKGQFTFYSFS